MCIPALPILGGGGGGNGDLPAAAGFRAQSQDQVIPNDPGFQKLDFPLEFVDTGSHYDPVASVWIPPAGLITLGAMVEFGDMPSFSRVEIAIGKNGGSPPQFIAVGPQHTGGQLNPQTNGGIVMCTDLANGTDIYEVAVRHNSPNFQNVQSGPNTIFFGMSGGIPGM